MTNSSEWNIISSRQRKMVKTFSFLILTSILAIFVQIVFYFIQFVPLLGEFLGGLVPLGRFFLFFFIGIQWASYLKDYSLANPFKKYFVSILAVLIGVIFLSSVVVEYNHLPWRIHKQKNISYKEALHVRDIYLEMKTGSSGLGAYLKYKGRQPLSFSAEHLGISEEDGDSMEGFGDLVAWVINLVLHLIPILFYKLVNNIFLWDLGGGYISMCYWFLFNCIITFLGFSSEWS